MRRACVLALLLLGGCGGDAAPEPPVARGLPCTPRAVEPGQSQELLVVLAADSDEPAGPVALVRLDGALQEVAASALAARWSPDGDEIAYLGADNFTPRTALTVMSADGERSRELDAWDGWGHELEWSPDGTRLLYARQPYPSGGDDAMLWSIAADGTNPVRLGIGSAAEWSPDGRSVALSRSDGVYVVPARGGTATRIATGGLAPRWVGDGRTIAFAGTGARRGLYVVVSAGGTPRRLLGRPVGLVGLSPDGCSALITDRRGLAVVSLVTGELRRLASNAGDEQADADWSSDGRVAFIRSAGSSALWVVAAAGGPPRLVRESPGYRVFMQPRWRP